MSQAWVAAERRWSDAAELLRSAGRAPVDLRDWLGASWSGAAADGFGEWGTALEEATRRAAAALSDAAAAAGAMASRADAVDSIESGWLDRLDEGVRSISEVTVPGEREPPRERVAESHQKASASEPRQANGSTGQGGKVQGWIDEAVQVLRDHGYRSDQMDPDAIATIIRHESAGNPSAVNHSDGNSARGTPSTGLMQTIPPTFRRYQLPGHGEILNPVDNIIAGVRYAVARYGSVSRVPGVLSVAAGHHYTGY